MTVCRFTQDLTIAKMLTQLRDAFRLTEHGSMHIRSLALADVSFRVRLPGTIDLIQTAPCPLLEVYHGVALHDGWQDDFLRSARAALVLARRTALDMIGGGYRNWAVTEAEVDRLYGPTGITRSSQEIEGMDIPNAQDITVRRNAIDYIITVLDEATAVFSDDTQDRISTAIATIRETE